MSHRVAEQAPAEMISPEAQKPVQFQALNDLYLRQEQSRPLGFGRELVREALCRGDISQATVRTISRERQSSRRL
jgi:hypothetical protein